MSNPIASTASFHPSVKNKINQSVYKTKIDGLYFIEPTFFPDERGFYSEIVRLPELEKVIGSPFIVKQTNLSHSKINVIRGLHAEGWNKLATVLTGAAFCALADLRPNSPTFAQVETFYLGVTKGVLRGSLFISQGIANSFCVVEGSVDYLYQVDKLYQDRDPKGDQSISVFDPDLNIPWPIAKDKLIISERDRQAISLRKLFPQKFT